MIPFQILQNNPAIQQEAWLSNALGGQNGVGYDLLSQFYPWKESISKSYKNLHLPLWNSYNQAGSPFLANIQLGYFYPANIFLLFFTTPTAITLIAIFNILVAAFGVYFFLRVLGAERIWSGLGAIGFIQSGYLVHWFQWIPHTGAMAWIPWMLAFMHLAFLRWDIKWIVCAQIAGSFAILSGHIQFAYYGLVAVTIYSLVMIIAGIQEGELSISKRFFRTIIFFVILATGIGLLTICQLWPSWELTQHALRGEENVNGLLANTFNLVQVLQLWSRKFLGAFDSVAGWAGYSNGLDNPFVPLFLSGTVLSVFLSGYIFKRRMLPLLSILLLAFGVTFGQKQIFFLAAKIPLFDHFRAPSRFGYIGCFALVVSCTLFISDYWNKLRNNEKIGFIKSRPYTITTLFFILVTGIVYSIYHKTAPDSHVLNKLFVVIIFLSLYQFIFNNIRTQPALFVWPLLFIVIGSIETIAGNFEFNPKMTKPDSGVVRLHHSLEEIGKDKGIGGRLVRVSNEVFEPFFNPPNLNLLHNIPDMHGYDTFIMKEYVNFFQGIDNNSLSSTAKGWNQVRNFKPEELHSSSMRLLGVKYVLSRVVLSPEYPLITKIGSDLLYELPGALPRVFLLPPDMTDESLQNHDIVLKEAIKLLGHYEINIDKIPNGYITELNSSSNAHLVLGELYYPGWRSWIDEVEVPTQPITHGLVSTKVGPGKHQIRFEYKPKYFFAALSASFFSWLLAIGYVIFVFFFRKNSKRKHNEVL